MSVRMADRGESKTEYLEAARQLAVDVSKVMANGPHKYKANHGDHLVKAVLEVYEHLQIAQSIWVAKGGNMEADHAQRRHHLKEAKGLVNHVAAATKVYFDVMKGCDDYDRGRASKRQQRIGERCARLSALISGVIEWDGEHLRKLRKG